MYNDVFLTSCPCRIRSGSETQHTFVNQTSLITPIAYLRLCVIKGQTSRSLFSSCMRLNKSDVLSPVHIPTNTCADIKAWLGYLQSCKEHMNITDISDTTWSNIWFIFAPSTKKSSHRSHSWIELCHLAMVKYRSAGSLYDCSNALGAISYFKNWIFM